MARGAPPRQSARGAAHCMVAAMIVVMRYGGVASDTPEQLAAAALQLVLDHGQSGTPCVTPRLAGLHVGDNRGGQGLRYSWCGYLRHHASQRVDLHRDLH